jgi:hypothetical protein
MATQEYAASIQGVSIRVTRLDAAGNLLNGPGDSYVTSAFMRASFTPEYEEGDEITEKNANGIVCVTYKSPDVLKRITMELAICEPDPEISNLISGGLLLRKNLGTFASPDNKSVGWASPAVGDDPAGFGVAIEVWSHAIKDGKKSSTLPYFHWVFPYAKLRQSGDRVIENGMLATTFEGYGLGNTQFSSGPDGRWEFPTAAERPYSYARATWAPVGLTGFYTWNYVGEGSAEDTTYNAVTNLDGISAEVTSVALTSNVATVTTTTAHSFAVGQSVTISGAEEALVVTNKSLTSNVASLTLSSVTANQLAVGDVVAITGVDTTFNATAATLTGVNTVTKVITYAVTADDVSATATSGAVVRAFFNTTGTIDTVPTTTTFTFNDRNGTAMARSGGNITTITSPNGAVASVGSLTSSTTGYNVPGNKDFNPDVAVDRVINSNENPTA